MYPLPPNHCAPRNPWYIAAWAAEIGRTPIGRWILDEPVALDRTAAGTPVALASRCPHRHDPLGKSRTVGDNICDLSHLSYLHKASDVAFGQAMQAGRGAVAEGDMVATAPIESMLGMLAEEPRDLLLQADADCVRGRRLFEAAIRKERANA